MRRVPNLAVRPNAGTGEPDRERTDRETWIKALVVASPLGDVSLQRGEDRQDGCLSFRRDGIPERIRGSEAEGAYR